MRLTIFFLLFIATSASAQYAPQAGIAGSTAISQSSPQIQGWATGCTVTRGYLDIARRDSGYVSSGSSSDASGAADGSLVSLGDSGIAVLTFAQPIANGTGADFAVFENGFPNAQNTEEAFLELAFVEVSSDGVNYFRFPARSLTQIDVQLSSIAGLGYINARHIHNLAGKYRAGFGTPFDLAELAGVPGLNVNAVTYVRLVDVVGSVTAHGSNDDSGRVINDPYPTFFPTGGFDLDAVAVLNRSLSITEGAAAVQLSIYPNPSTGAVRLETGRSGAYAATILDPVGRVVLHHEFSGSSTQLDLSRAASGLYRILLQTENFSPCSASVFIH
jgi:hypothetical protein